MKYDYYEVEDFVEDDYFQNWVLHPDSMTDKFWNTWIDSNPEKKEIIVSASEMIKILNSDHRKLLPVDFDAMWQNIVQKKSKAKTSSFLSRIFYSKLFKVAAIFIIGLITTLGIYHFNHQESIRSETVAIESGITLELEDGTLKVIDQESLEAITNSKGETVVIQNQDKLLYNQQNGEVSKKLSYNTLTVPYGKKFELVFSDGSHAFLNSGSKLRYPVSFLKNTPRNVFLDGEAFFLVEKDKSRPFTVQTNDMNVRVYGTEFNVSNYKNEGNTSVVLAEGSVSVYEPNDNLKDASIFLKPGQRAVYKNQKITVDEVDVNKYIAWTKGQLYFVDTPFHLIVKELERHFNVVIDNEFSDLKSKKFTGTFEKESLDEILKVCQQHTYFNFYMENEKVIITEPKNDTN